MIGFPSARQRVRALAAGRAARPVVVPLALHVAGRIQERDPEGFLQDPTQLANALRDLVDAVHPDGVPVTDPDVLLSTSESTDGLAGSPYVDVAVEATRRLKGSMADSVALLAHLPSPATVAIRHGCNVASAAEAVTATAQKLLSAGIDVVLITADEPPTGMVLSTLANIARFHQAVAACPGGSYGLATPTVVTFESPVPGEGLTVSNRQLERRADITVLRDWISAVAEAGA